MHEVTIYPLGNADSTRIDLDGGEKILVDYADVRDPDDDSDKRIDLPEVLRDDLDEDNRSSYDVVGFTHLHNDHVAGASDFFYLRHADKYQGRDRIKIQMLWVPAAAILEEDLDGDARVIQQEARYRLKKGKDIHVFSTPGQLDNWLEDQGIDPASREDLFVDAGERVPDFDFSDDGLEVFVHTPHATRSDDGELLSRNDDALAFQATFSEDGQETRMHFFSDLTHEVIDDIVRITEYHQRDRRLEWDLFHLPHHSSYRALSEEKGDEKTDPVTRVEKLFEEYGEDRARMVSTSKVIPDEDTDQPPHRQAANYYKSVADELNGEYVVTMKHPTEDNPEPLEIEIDGNGPTLMKEDDSGEDSITGGPSPRAGWS
jgi:glyoxylase-like metal-dependent hydrolase (beta-lactamase superfamily II)